MMGVQCYYNVNFKTTVGSLKVTGLAHTCLFLQCAKFMLVKKELY